MAPKTSKNSGTQKRSHESIIRLPEGIFDELDKRAVKAEPVPEHAIFTEDVMERYGVSQSHSYLIIRNAVRCGGYKEGYTRRNGKRVRYIYKP